MSYLEIEGLSKRYGETAAVDGISLAVEKGEFVSLLGPSGCGKTTTLQMIAGFVEPSAGRISLDGRDLGNVKAGKRGLGIVFQSYALFPHMTAAENVAFGLEMRAVPRAERDGRVKEILDLVGLGGFADRYPKRMSGGQQQRVALARALVIKPSMLLLDEPLSNLDAKLREEMQVELRQIQRTLGTTTILVTHDQAEAMALSDRIVVMNKGCVEQIAKPHEAYEWPASAFVANFLGRTNALGARILQDAEGSRILVGAAAWPAGAALPPGPVTLTIRPEKIAFAAAGGLAGTVRSRIFQGTQWLFQIDTEAGATTVIRQNDGAVQPSEGAAVHLAWNAEDMSILPGEDRR